MVVDAQSPGPAASGVTPQPAALLARLSDPKVVASLDVLLDHVDLLAVMVEGLDGFIRRGDVISDNLALAVGDLRTAAQATGTSFGDIDLSRLISGLAELSGPLAAAAPGLRALLTSRVSDPRFVGVVGDLADALIEGATTHAGGRGPSGVVGLLRALRDPDVSRTIGFLLHVARCYGRRLDRKPLSH